MVLGDSPCSEVSGTGPGQRWDFPAAGRRTECQLLWRCPASPSRCPQSPDITTWICVAQPSVGPPDSLCSGRALLTCLWWESTPGGVSQVPVEVMADAQGSPPECPELPSSRPRVGQLWLLAHSFGVSPGRARLASPESPGLAFPAQGVPEITWPYPLTQPDEM